MWGQPPLGYPAGKRFSRDSAHLATASDDGLRIKVFKMGCYSGAGLISCQPLVSARGGNQPPTGFVPGRPALRNPARLGVLGRRTGPDSAREIREYSIPDFSNNHNS
jgi:hypothetical protein